MALENSSKKPTPEMEESFLVDQQFQLTVEDDFSYFCKFDDLATITDSQIPEPNNKSDSNENQEPSEVKGSQLVDNFEVEDDFSYFCMYDDLMGANNLHQIEQEEESAETYEPSKKSSIYGIEGLTPTEYAQGLERIFDAFSLVQTRKKLTQYFKGKITPGELLADTNDHTIYNIYTSINRVLNFKYKTIQYYIQLPVDVFFNTKYCMGGSYILAFKLDETFEDSQMVNLVGPNNFKWGTYAINEYIEIDGDFSQIPSGAKLTTNDYLQILKKYPNIIKLISYLFKTDCVFASDYVGKSDEEMQQLAEEHFQKWQGWHPKTSEQTSKSEENQEGITILSQETIDSITFVQPVEYVTLEEVKNGTFGTFEELLVRTNSFQSSPIQDGEAPKVLKLTTPKNTGNK